MRKLATISIILFCSSSALAQTRTTGSSGSVFGSSSIFNPSGPTVGSTLNSGTSGTAATGTSTTSTLGANFNFSQGFAATGITNPFGATAGRTGMTGIGGMGGLGMGGLGMGGFGMGGLGMGGFGMGGMGMGGFGMGGMGMNRGQQNMRGGTTGQQYQLRPTVTLGFTPTETTPQARSQQVSNNLARVPSPERFAGAKVTVQGRTAVVSGTIDEGQMEVFKRLLQLEPGIDKVDFSQVNGGKNSSRTRTGAETVVPVEANSK